MSAIVEAARKNRAAVNYHQLRQLVFEHSLLLMESVLGRKGRLIDLGAGHCTFTLISREMGWKVTALDVRSTRVPPLPEGVTFIDANVDSDSWRVSDYDLVVCLGLYYHLTQEMQHRLLTRCRGTPLIIDTHFANPPGVPTRYKNALGPTHDFNGETGADFLEAGDLSEEQRKQSAPRASIDNPTSWWQTKESLLDTIHNYGWQHVWAFDHNQMESIQRTFFVCYSANQATKGVTGIRI